MEQVLYAPGLGYYSAGVVSFGLKGDFVTAPEVSPLFGRVLARQAAQVLAETAGDILELGAGSGTLAAEMLAQLHRDQALPRRYAILELSQALRERQQATLSERVPELVSRVDWLDCLPATFDGFMFGNEVLDALPVRIIVWADGEIMERGVVLSEGRFAWEDRPIQDAALAQAVGAIDAQAPYVSEISLAASALTATLCQVLRKGVLLFIDYGFGSREYYHPQRSSGTLMCHYRQHVHDDPLVLPGIQDVTAHVNFSAVAEAAVEAGGELMGYTSQAQFLINGGITDFLAGTKVEDSRRYLPLASGLQVLTSPAEMGELFKVIAFGNSQAGLTGFRAGDRTRQL
jgi:SAM-dependent MidA family methyltransferase